MLKKLGKKLKKGLKKAAPIIALVGAAALAAKKGKALTPRYSGAGLDSSGAPRTDFVSGDATTAENISNFDRGMTKIADAGGVANLKQGGRVKGAGVAKRGFGRAFKGGRK